jgi:hypothetical protein
VKDGEGDNVRRSGRRLDRELVLGADGGGGEAAMPEVESPCTKGHGLFIDVWMVRHRLLRKGKSGGEPFLDYKLRFWHTEGGVGVVGGDESSRQNRW